MFRLKNNATASYAKRFKEAHRHLPQAEHRAQEAAFTHLHGVASDAVRSVGGDPSPLSLQWKNGSAHIQIDKGEAGDKLFDEEFGRPDIEQGMPHPVIRTAVNNARPQARGIYKDVLRRELGI